MTIGRTGLGVTRRGKAQNELTGFMSTLLADAPDAAGSLGRKFLATALAATADTRVLTGVMIIFGERGLIPAATNEASALELDVWMPPVPAPPVPRTASPTDVEVGVRSMLFP